MSWRQLAVAATLLAVAGATAWGLFVFLPRRYGSASSGVAGPAAVAPAPAGRRIKARLFYISADGTQLTGVERDVPLGDDSNEQASHILSAQLAPPAAPLVSAIPPGTSLRAVFLTPRGDAYVDLSGEVSRNHPGGTLGELLTVYTVVHALTANLPAITRVQVLIDGQTVTTLAGHVDLRHPLFSDPARIQ